MNEQEQKSILTLCLMAAFADGDKHERERAEIKRIADALASDASINIAALYQDVLLKRVSLTETTAALTTPESRLLGFEMAVCVCDADGMQSDAERRFLAGARAELGLNVEQAQAYTDQAEAIAAAPLQAAAPASSTSDSKMSDQEMDKTILNAAIVNGALELLPESLATMAIIPLQMKLVYRIGQSYGFELDRGHIKDFLATVGVGLTSQYLEQAGRKLLGGLLGKVGGGLLGKMGGGLARGVGNQAVSSGMSFASTYALGHVAKRYYAGGRTLSTEMLKESFDNIVAEAKNLQARYLPEMQAKASTLDATKILNMVRQG
ncbi:MAG: TerB family tellurite resistance protein [Pseudomonadota bacterium]|nr:TerB family tellurite resistance protein [Pseudomonadota bacterium]